MTRFGLLCRGSIVTLVTLAAVSVGMAAEGIHVPGQPFSGYTTTDRLGRSITYYLSEAPADAPPKPLIVYVQGSGAGSLFQRYGDRVVPALGEGSVVDVAGDRARVLVVEKPGVALYGEMPHGDPGPELAEFCKEHTLDRWAAAIAAALDTVRKLPGIDGNRILVMGHSEGGLVACRVAADNPCVTHVATLAGGGATQLVDLIELVRRGDFGKGLGDDPDERVRQFIEMWREVLADPDSAEKMFMGHPHRRWSTFLATSPMEELVKTNARTFVGQGQNDQAVWPASADVLYGQLLSRGKDVTLRRVAGADHSFAQVGAEGAERSAGWQAMIGDVVNWFLAD
ncbi:MAG: alpha/beta fold hydrolase [Phycisphaerales bacterium]|nr:alpha/beta fold hydrolase [Phycisphaerales bacterium]